MKPDQIAAESIEWMLIYIVISSVIFIATLGILKAFPSISIRGRNMLLKLSILAGLIFSIASQITWAPQSSAAIIQTPVFRDAVEIRDTYIPAKSPPEVSPIMATPTLQLDYDKRLGILSLILLLTSLSMLAGKFWHHIRFLQKIKTRSSAWDNSGLNLRGLDIPQKVRIYISDAIEVPFTSGGRSIYLPVQALEKLPQDQFVSLIAHEVQHIRRRDHLWLLIGESLESLLFFQPLIRIVNHRIECNTEQICDERAISLLPDRAALAHCLMEVSSWNQLRSLPGTIMSLAKKYSFLYHRIHQIIKPESMSRQTIPSWAFVVLIALCGGLVSWVLPKVQIQTAEQDVHSSVSMLEYPGIANDTIPKKKKKEEVKVKKVQQAASVDKKNPPDDPEKIRQQKAIEELERQLRDSKQNAQSELEQVVELRQQAIKEYEKQYQEALRELEKKLSHEVQEVQVELEESRRQLQLQIAEMEKELEKEEKGSGQYRELERKYQQKIAEMEAKQRDLNMQVEQRRFEIQEQRALMEAEQTRSIQEMRQSAEEMEIQLREELEQKELEMEDAIEAQEQMSQDVQRERERVLELERQMKEKQAAMEKDVTSGLIEDGIIENAAGFKVLSINDDEVSVNGNKLPRRLHQKYIDIISKYFEVGESFTWQK